MAGFCGTLAGRARGECLRMPAGPARSIATLACKNAAILSVWAGLAAATAIGAVQLEPVQAQERITVEISVQNHSFQPSEVEAPANKPLVLKVKNLDATAMEFESASLRVEKVVTANSEGTINVRPLQPGRYSFFDDFHHETTGTLVVRE